MIIRRSLVILLMLNAAAVFLVAAGSGSVWGIELQTGMGAIVEEVNSAAQNITSGPVGLIQAVGGLAIAAVSLVVSLLTLVFAAPLLFQNLGVPTFITTFLFAPLYIVVALDLVTIIRGGSEI